jgi:signal transduction histidine kinase
MDGLIQDLLQYGRLGHMDLPREPVDLSARIAAVLNYLAEEIKSSGGDVKVAEPLPQVWANVKVLDQVLSNLVGNALKFVEPGVSPQIRIGSELHAEMVRLWIQDNGIGIDAEHHERVFGVFERLNGTDAYPGSGIGLAIVRKGVERMGGRVGVESKLGAGSRFWLDLPHSRKTA